MRRGLIISPLRLDRLVSYRNLPPISPFCPLRCDEQSSTLRAQDQSPCTQMTKNDFCCAFNNPR